ncbi:FkbM family methyltransferase [Puia sp.]|jgi:FkbM family methyltransferase|uniref:FkbM family methyltransferase n=1 Tax=Puia sp. TaxID=2045100 RepID=UPI002F40138B
MKRLIGTILNGRTARKNTYKKSYSQCGEDLIIDFILEQIGVTQPTYIDIGAHHPFYLNNTAFFSSKGSTGINVEPDPYLFAHFLKERPKDTNLNVGVAEREGQQDFYIMSTPTMNTFSREVADQLVANSGFAIKEVRKTPLLDLNSILRQHNGGKFPDLFSLDVEGLDEQIIRSIDFDRHAPKVICIETLTYSENGNGVKNTALIELISSKGYMNYADTYINTIFVKENLWKKNI